MPLEQVGLGRGILSRVIKFYRPLDALKCLPGMEFSQELCLIKAFHVCDCLVGNLSNRVGFRSMTSEQPYQAAFTATDARAELEQCVGTQFDPELLPVFRTVLESRHEGNDSYWAHARSDLLSQV